MSQFVMTRARYEILCALRTEAHTMSELQEALNVGHLSNLAAQLIALRNAGLVEPRGHRISRKRGPKPLMYVLTEKGEAAIQAARVPLAMKASTIIELSDLEVAE